MIIKGIEKIDFNIGKEVYIYQKDYIPLAVQENKEGNTTIDLSEIFKDYEKWKWGIKTKKYYSVLLTAISFKTPHLSLSVPNVLISLEPSKDKKIYYITALVFDENEETAIKNAWKFKSDNRNYIAFEITGDYKKYPVEVYDLQNLIANIYKEIKEVKEITTKTFKETKKSSELSKIVLEEIKSLKEIFTQQMSFLFKRVDELENKMLKTEEYEIHVINDKGVYIDGEKVYVKMLGEVFDYLDVDVDSFISFFGFSVKKEKKKEIKENLYLLCKEKFLTGSNLITFKEANNITGLSTKNMNNWIIVLQIKDEIFQQVVKTLKKTADISSKKAEQILKKSIENAVKEGKQSISFDDLIKFAGDDEKEKLLEMQKLLNLQGKKDFDLGNKAIVVSDDRTKELLVMALTLEANKRGKKVKIRGL